MFKNIKQNVMKKMIKSKLPKNMPQEQRDRILDAVSNNPELFDKIGKEIKKKMKQEDKDQTTATMEVMRQHQSELSKLM